MKFLVPNYSCLQNPWLGGYHPQIPVLSVLNWICWTPHEKNSWVRHWSWPALIYTNRVHHGYSLFVGSYSHLRLGIWCLPGEDPCSVWVYRYALPFPSKRLNLFEQSITCTMKHYTQLPFCCYFHPFCYTSSSWLHFIIEEQMNKFHDEYCIWKLKWFIYRLHSVI